jgi:hypothetical protein
MHVRVDQPEYLNAGPAVAARGVLAPFAQHGLREPKGEPLLSYPLAASQQQALGQAIFGHGPKNPLSGGLVPG